MRQMAQRSTRTITRGGVAQHGITRARNTMLFDWLVVGQVLPFNLASSVRGPKHVVKSGKTPVLSAKERPTHGSRRNVVRLLLRFRGLSTPTFCQFAWRTGF